MHFPLLAIPVSNAIVNTMWNMASGEKVLVGAERQTFLVSMLSVLETTDVVPWLRRR